jgi:hypothetical protein
VHPLYLSMNFRLYATMRTTARIVTAANTRGDKFSISGVFENMVVESESTFSRGGQLAYLYVKFKAVISCASS